MIRLSTPEAIQQVAMPGGWTLTMRTVDAPAFDMARRRASAAAVALMASEETRARYGLSADDVAPLKAHLDATTGHEDLADQVRGVVFGAGIHMLAVEIANAHAIGWTGVVDDEGEDVPFDRAALAQLLRQSVVADGRTVWFAEALVERACRTAMAELAEGNG